MGFTDAQEQELKAKLHKRYIQTREVNGTELNYVSGWHAISQANKIFGFDGWDRQTVEPKLLWSHRRNNKLTCMYATKVRITVKAGEHEIIREGIGTGAGHNEIDDLAHEMAMKAAETDATKRALATFGNPFGLGLYDSRSQSRSKTKKQAKTHSGVNETQPSLTLSLPNQKFITVDTSDALRTAVAETLQSLKTIDDVYAFWEDNLQLLTGLRENSDKEVVQGLIGVFKTRLRDIGIQKGDQKTPSNQAHLFSRPKERRIRDKVHLRFVAHHPCVICGRQPTQAHHVKYAQPRSMALKVSDEYTVPLCNVHHDQLHRAGDEKSWWAQHKLNPLEIAQRLWTVKDKSLPFELEGTPK